MASSTVETAVPHATQHDPQWLEMLQQFKDSYPEGNLPTEITPVDTTTPLGEWMIAQQSAYEEYTSGENDGLAEERINLLTGAGFLFESQLSSSSSTSRKRKADSLNDDWDDMFEGLKQFKEDNGHCIPTTQ